MNTATPEWSVKQRVLELEKPLEVTIKPNAAERGRLAKRAGVSVASIEALEARLTIAPEPGLGRFHVHGDFDAELTQICVRSAAPFRAVLEAPVQGYFADKEGTLSFAKARKKREEEMGDQPNFVDEEEDPEPLENGAVDLGELVAQHLILAVDPYPVCPGAEPLPEEGMGDKVKVENPFAILGQLRAFIGKDE